MSMMTMELSTIIPSDMISTASVTVLSSIPKALNSPRDMNMVMGMVDAATRATLMGSRSMTTITTATMAMTSSSRKFATLSLTTWLWSVMR